MVAVMKRKAVAKAKAFSFDGAKSARKKTEDDFVESVIEAAAVENSVEEEQEQEDEEENKEDISEEDKVAQEEEELTTARKKELKAMPLDNLKSLVTSQGLETGKKGDMMEAILAHEAQGREAKRAHKAKVRAAVLRKKEELEALPLSELKGLCSQSDIKGILSKQARVEQLLIKWQADDGVDKMLAKMAHDEREEELVSMDKASLQKVCEKINVDPLVKELMADRIVQHEHMAGRFAKPQTVEQEDVEEAAPSGKKGDMVDALLANESKRKKDNELKKKREEAEANKKKELKSMSLDALKKTLTEKGSEPTGKKDDMVEALFLIWLQEEAVAAKKAKLKSMGFDDLKQLLSNKGLEVGKKEKIEKMVDRLLAHEAQVREELDAFEAKAGEALAKIREELGEKTGTELKDLCASKGLKVGVGKEERIERLLEDARQSGEVDKAVVAMSRAKRREDLLAMDKEALRALCEETHADPLVKEAMVERILAHEDEFGRTKDDEPATKKAKVAKK